VGLAAVAAVAAALGGPGGPGPPDRARGEARAADAPGRPTPAPQSAYPLGIPPWVADVGDHAFMATQPGSAEPVAYDPCRTLRVVVNGRTEPRRGARLLEEALALVAGATGLRIEVEGATAERPADRRPSVQPDRYGDRWAPVLVAWSDRGETPELAGDVAGVAGSAVADGPGHPAVYVTGSVVLDGPQLGAMVDVLTGGWQRARAVVLHELGHLVGLAHVDDDTQLLAARGRWDVVGFGAGDRAGLAELGRGACVPQL
jgi:hypothetical protein